MKSSVGMFIILAVVMLSAEIRDGNAFVLNSDSIDGAHPCRLSNPTGISYFNANLTGIDADSLSYAAEAWNDAPALVHLSSTSSSGGATIQVLQFSDPSQPKVFGATWNGADMLFHCPGQVTTSPVYIRINVYAIALSLDQHTLPSTSLNVRIHNLAHEMGHAMGLGHSPTKCALMYLDIGASEQCGVDFPVVDDVKGMAALYGWSGDTGFASTNDFNGYPIDGGGTFCGHSLDVGPCRPPAAYLSSRLEPARVSRCTIPLRFPFHI